MRKIACRWLGLHPLFFIAMIFFIIDNFLVNQKECYSEKKVSFYTGCLHATIRWGIFIHIPSNAELLLAHRLRRRPYSKPTVAQRLMFAGMPPNHLAEIVFFYKLKQQTHEESHCGKKEYCLPVYRAIFVKQNAWKVIRDTCIIYIFSV